MTDQNWKPLLRAPMPTVTKVLRSHAFLHSRERSAAIADNAEQLRALADLVETLDHASAPLAAVADRIVAAVRLLRARADLLDAAAALHQNGHEIAEPQGDRTSSASAATRERLLIASLDYLVTPVDLVPDFRAGGYIDDVVLLAWVFGVASAELAPFLTDDADDADNADDPDGTDGTDGGEAAPPET